jgi:DNA primase
LSVHIDSGAFKCFACGAKGGDVLAFHRLLNGSSFVEAVTDLDAWEVL